MQTIALFGGSFDPPHKGHERVVQEVLKIEGIDKVVVMPTYLNPFKSRSYAPSALRLKWLENIFQAYTNVEVDSFEVDLQRQVPSIESVKYLLKKTKKIFLVIGADNLESLHKWKNYDELQSLVTFIVASRDSIKIPKSFLTLKIDEDISSTQLRTDISSLQLSDICSNEITQFYKAKNEH